MDDLVAGYLVDICTSASKTAQNSQRTKLKLEDFRFAIRHDPIKLARSDELIATNKLITEAKKQFNSTDNQSLKKVKEGDNDEEEEEEDDDEDADDDNDAAGFKRKAKHDNKTAKSNRNKNKRAKQQA